MANQVADPLERLFWPKGSRRDIWMIADAARERRVYSLLLDCHLEYSCLYGGHPAPELKVAAPYLVQLEYDYKDTHRLLNQSWGNSWGVLLKCDTSLNELRKHLKGLLVARDMRGASLLFRYYDPRVLRVYLPTCTRNELSLVFGPIECFWVEDEKPGTLLEFRFDQVRLATKELSIDGPTPFSTAAIAR